MFHGLARLKPTHLHVDIRRLFEHPDLNVLRGALWLIGELKLRGFVDSILSFLNHSNQSIRQEASRTLAALDQKNVQSLLVNLLEPSSPPLQLAAAIRALEQSNEFSAVVKVAEFKTHPSADIRVAVASYLGASQLADYFEDLLLLLQDDDREVRSAAARGVRQLASISGSQKEAKVIPLLAESFQAGRELQVSVLMGVLASCASEASREVLISIYRQDDGRLKNHQSFDMHGNWACTIPVDLKTQALTILRRFDISELHSDIVESLHTCESDLLPRYLEIAGEKKIPEAFEALTSFPPARLEYWPGFTLQAMHKIDPNRSLEWAREVIRTTSSPALMSHCCDFLERHGINPRRVDGFISRLLAIFSDLGNRCHPVLYRLIRRHRIKEAGPQIVKDIPLLLGPQAKNLNMPVYEMFETLAVLEYAEGHNCLIKLLPGSPPHFRKAILEYLGRYRPKIGVPELQRYRTDPELSIRELCDRLLGQNQSADRNECVQSENPEPAA